MESKGLKTAIVVENLFSIGGANMVNLQFADIFPNADIYALFGSEKFVKKYFPNRRVKFSFLNRFPFIKQLYVFTLHLWPTAIESFDLSNYDLVLSSSHTVAKGCITSQNSKHISYIHTPMRYLWDLKNLYSKYRFLRAPFLNYLRIWDVYSSKRPDFLISNSKFVATRCKRYWGRDVDRVIYPPVQLYKGDIVECKDRGDYFVSGAPFAENKGGEFLISCAKSLGFKLKIVGGGRGCRRLMRLASGFGNIEFLGRVSENEKWDILSHAKGFVASGIEDFGIFPVESISCGTPVLASKCGGYLESIVDTINGVFYAENTLESFKMGFEKLNNGTWNIERMRSTVVKFGKERFIKEVEEFIRNSI